MAEDNKKAQEVTDGEESAEAAAESSGAIVGSERAPFTISKGARFRLGYRIGRVDSLRGGIGIPYDARVTWEGEKYPQYLLYQNLKREYENGNLELL